MSDGERAWSDNLGESACHERNSVILEIETAIDGWNINSDLLMHFQSFTTMFRLVGQFENPICQRWACWTLANLTTIERNMTY